MRILVVDDEEEVRDLLVRALVRDGHQLASVPSLRAAGAALDAREADLVVLDLGLPDGSGVELCRSLRAAGNDVPILVLTARSEVGQRVEALDAGADDYLVKPFALAELRARIRALVRRRRGAARVVLTFGDAAIDLSRRSATRGDVEVRLTAREWTIFEALASRNGRVVGRDTLLDEVWGEANERTAASLDVLVGRIRRKLGETVIRTMRGAGYALGGA